MDTRNPLEDLIGEEERVLHRPSIGLLQLPSVLAAEKMIRDEMATVDGNALEEELNKLLPVRRRAQLLVELAENTDGEPSVSLKAITTINEITKVSNTGSAGVTFVLPDGTAMKIKPEVKEDPS